MFQLYTNMYKTHITRTRTRVYSVYTYIYILHVYLIIDGWH